MPSKLNICTFEARYIENLVELIHSTIQKIYPEFYSPEVIDFFLDYHRPEEILRKHKEGVLLVAFESAELVACGYLVEDEIGGIYVHPGRQRCGIGNLILQSLLKTAREKNLSIVWLDSTPIAKKMYESSGFEVVEDRVMYVKNNVPLPYFYMEKEL